MRLYVRVDGYQKACAGKHADTGSKRHLCSPPNARVCRYLGLYDNDLTALPEGIFAPLTELG